MGIAILPSYLIGRDTTRGKLVRLLSDYRLPQVEINIAYPSRKHLPTKVRSFIDFMVDEFERNEYERKWTSYMGLRGTSAKQ